MSVKSFDDEVEEITSLELQGPSVIESLTRGEIDLQIRTAKAYPRSITHFRRNASQMVTLDQETAEACIYSVPRGGKPQTGPSVRFAEIILSAWGNSRAGYRPVEESERHVTAQGVFADLENNTAITAEVRRGIVQKSGRRFSDDMINVTMNAAGSIAFRNAVLRGIPQALWRAVYEAAKRTAIGTAETLIDRRGKALEYFGKMGINLERILYRLEREGIDDITLVDLETLTGLKTAVKDGLAVDQAFPPVGSREATASLPPGKGADALTERLKSAPLAVPLATVSQTREPGEEEPEPEEPFRESLSRYRDAFAVACDKIGRNGALALAAQYFETSPDEASDEQLGLAAGALNAALSDAGSRKPKK